MANNSQFTGMQPIQPPPVASLGPSLNPIPPMPLHYRPVVQVQQPPSYIPLAPQFQHMGNSNVVMPHPPPPHPSQQMYQQPMPHIPIGQAQAIPVPDYQQNATAAAAPPQPQPNVPVPNTYMPGFGGPQMPPSAPQNSWSSTADQSMKPVTPLQQSAEAHPAAPNQEITSKPKPTVDSPLLWIIHTARNGKRYYYNRLTKLSTWEKPLDLMTAIERADATTDWREYTSPDGRKYFYNRVTKQSKWRMPDEVKVARERVNPESLNEPEPKAIIYQRPSALPTSGVNASSSSAEAPNSQSQPEASSPVPVAPIVADQSVAAPAVSTSPSVVSPVTSDAIEMQTSVEPSDPVTVSEKDPVSSALATNNSNPVSPIVPDPVVVASAAGDSPGKNEEAKNIKENAQSDEKAIDQGPLVYENKQDAKNAFKELLESTNVGSDWIWDQAMKAIINDKRYGALKSLGERKQAFNEFVSQKKKQEVEEKRARQKQAREDFKNMLEESKELTSSTRWSKAQSMFQDDERFKVVEKSKDREDLFMDYLEELEKKERVKAVEEYKRIKAEYLEFLKSCEFIQASSQWRRVQDRLEADERCSRLEKIDRLEIFQEYIRDLEKEEEELMRLQMEEQRKVERKNRDEFRKLMEEHIISGLLTGKTIWRDYSLKVKDLPAFHAVSSNSSGPSAKDLFEDVFEELEKRYLDDKARIRDAVNFGEVTLTSNSTLDEFKDAISKDLSSPVSDYNLKLVFDELYERAREKEEREAKKRKRLTDELSIFLHSSKDITSSSRWEDCKQLIEERFVADAGFLQEVFDKFISELKAKEKERKRRDDKERRDKERKRSRKDKEKGGESRNKEKGGESRKRKERSRSGTESDHKEKGGESRKRKERSRSGTESDRVDSHGSSRRSGRDKKDRKHRRRHSSSFEETHVDDNNDRERSRKKSHRHSNDYKKKRV